MSTPFILEFAPTPRLSPYRYAGLDATDYVRLC